MTVLCAVKRDNVVFAVTHHGGHLGYFEGGILLPNSVTWLDRVVVEFSTALLCCKMPASPHQHQTYTTNNSFANYEPSVKKSPLAHDDDDDDDVIELQQQASSKPDTANKLAAEMVAEVLRVSASVVYDDTSTPTFPNNEDVVMIKSAKKMKSPKNNHKQK